VGFVANEVALGQASIGFPLKVIIPAMLHLLPSLKFGEIAHCYNKGSASDPVLV
jgi:hypothetical protein